jgi:hypothetical protein
MISGHSDPVIKPTAKDQDKTPDEIDARVRFCSHCLPFERFGTNYLMIQDKPINVMIGFKLFIAKKTQQKKKSWGPINSTHDFPITVTFSKTSFESFQNLVAAACDKEFSNTASVILKGLNYKPQGIFWYGSIARCATFAKKDRFELKSYAEYNEWLDMACKLGRSEVGLAIQMTNPAKLAQQAEMEDLLAAQAIRDEAARVASSKQKALDGPGDSEDEESEELDPDEWDSINLHMKRLYATHLVKTAYDRHTPVFIDPQNHDRYILLTCAACSEWAKALVCHFLIPILALMCDHSTDSIIH